MRLTQEILDSLCLVGSVVLFRMLAGTADFCCYFIILQRCSFIVVQKCKLSKCLECISSSAGFLQKVKLATRFRSL